MEVMSYFELDRTIINLGHQEMISFQIFKEKYMLSYTDFLVRMGLLDVEYTGTTSYL